MNRKNVQILLSILHICVFCIGILIIYHNLNAAAHPSVAVMPDNTLLTADTETEIQTETERNTEFVSEPETQAAPETETESLSEIETETVEAMVSYAFQYTGGIRNLNIRKGPSMDDEIIGRIPPNDGGNVLELTDGEWALIEYHGITGYCNLEWMVLTPVEAFP